MQQITYDSAFEKESADYLSTLSVVRCNNPFPVFFSDKEGAIFNALSDFYHPPTGLLIELKCNALNSKTTVKSAKNAMQRIEDFRDYKGQSVTNFDMIENSWSNSIYKQSIVQLKMNSSKFILVFDKLPPIAEALRLVKKGLTFCDLKSLPSYLAFVQFQQHNITLFQFTIDYPEDGYTFVLTRSA